MTRFPLPAAFAAALLAMPAFAQPSDPGVLREMQRERTNPSVPSVPLQDRAATGADRMDDDLIEPTQWLKQAQAAIERGHTGEANELIERAETRMLSRSRPADRADEPVRGPVLRHVTAARAALAARDNPGALRELELALVIAERRGTPR